MGKDRGTTPIMELIMEPENFFTPQDLEVIKTADSIIVKAVDGSEDITNWRAWQDVGAIRKPFSDNKNFSGHTRCMFHPDLIIKFISLAGSFELTICLSCHEVGRKIANRWTTIAFNLLLWEALKGQIAKTFPLEDERLHSIAMRIK